MVLYEKRVDLYRVDYKLYIFIHSLGQFTISGDNSLVVFDEHSSQQTRYLLIDNPVVSSYKICIILIVRSLYLFTVVTLISTVTSTISNLFYTTIICCHL